MVLTLYHNPISTCSQKVRLALAEKGLSYESRVMDFRQRDHLSDWYLAINPNGVVPAIEHNGQPVIDSSVICEYLEEVYPKPALSPENALDRARMRAWMRYFEEVPTAAIRIPSFNKLFAGELAAMDRDAFDAMTDRMPLRRHLYRQMSATGFSEQQFNESLEKLRKCLERVAATLDDKRPYLLGAAFSLADIVLVPSVVRMVDLGLQHLWQDLPGIAAWIDRVQARPSFPVAFYPGSRVKLPVLEESPAGAS